MTGGRNVENNESVIFIVNCRMHIELERSRDMSLGYRDRQPSPQMDRSVFFLLSTPHILLAPLTSIEHTNSLSEREKLETKNNSFHSDRFRALGIDRAVENAELQDKLDKAQNELRRAQAELRLNQSDYERSQVEMEQMQEKVEKSQGEIYRLRAKLENTQAENENIQEEFDKIQQALSRSYAERDKYASEMDKTREELERVQVRLEVI